MTAFHVEILCAASMLMAAVALGLLWRCRLLGRALGAARAAPDQVLQAVLHDALRDERRRIASDIHDDLGQNLLTLKMELAALITTPGMPAAAGCHIATLLAHTDAGVRSLRGIINGLRPVDLEQGLRCAVERQLTEFSRISGIRFQLEMALHGEAEARAREGVEGNDNAAEAIVFRVLQESLSNIARHAGATEVRIVLCRGAHELSMTVRDNGVGMPGGQPRHGCGLLGIEQRVAAAGGRFTLDSDPGQGTALTVSIPAAASAANQPVFARQHARSGLRRWRGAA